MSGNGVDPVQPDPSDDPNAIVEGEALHAAISGFVGAMYDEDDPLVTRFVVIAEADDGCARWVEVVAFSADGIQLPEWESIGLIEYAKRVESREFTHATGDEDEDSDDA